MNKNLPTEQLVLLWESRRAVKNLMGKYINCVAQNRFDDLFDVFWSKEDDISLALNDGAYIGQKDVKAFYGYLKTSNQALERILKKDFAKFLEGKSEEQTKGIGPFRFFPITNTIVEVAKDNKTAKGLWHSFGSDSEINQFGPDTRWTWGWFAVDFIHEETGWKIWHMQYAEDFSIICGNSWGKEQPAQEPDPVFAELSGYSIPEFTLKKQIYQPYSVTRRLQPIPGIPEPYDTFDRTFSYRPE